MKGQLLSLLGISAVLTTIFSFDRLSRSHIINDYSPPATMKPNGHRIKKRTIQYDDGTVEYTIKFGSGSSYSKYHYISTNWGDRVDTIIVDDCSFSLRRSFLEARPPRERTKIERGDPYSQVFFPDGFFGSAEFVMKEEMHRALGLREIR
jgi:hypothetical protein